MKSIDIYSYPDEDVLVNKFNCHDKDKLAELEAIISGYALLNLQLHPISGKFGFAHLKKIHHAIFKDIYEWAGKPRTIDIGKNNLFCRAQFIGTYAESVFREFYSDCASLKNNKDEFTRALATHYSDMNALHPFREGNGRAQREFTRELCLKCGYMLDFTRTTHAEMLEASVASFNTADTSKFITVFDKCVIPLDTYGDLQKDLTSKFLTLSSDDIDSGILYNFPSISGDSSEN